MRQKSVTFQFVEFIPERIEPGVLYISTRYAVAVHACCCGCGSQVVTQLSPIKWKLVFDGKTVSLLPSIGNWGLPCESHYWIDRNVVRWAAPWSRDEIDEGREHAAALQAHYYNRPRDAAAQSLLQPDAEAEPTGAKRASIWARLKRRLWRRE